jgi:hypothetical protein
MSVCEAWHVFQVRKALMTHWSVGFDFGFGFNSSLRTPLLRDAIASLLYVELVTILDEAFEEHMAPDEYTRGKKVKNRIKLLSANGDLIDPKGLLKINDRRNDIGHELEKGATVKELEDATEVVKAQLLSWGLVRDKGAYSVRAQRNAMYDTGDPEWPMAQDVTIQVTPEDKVQAELKQTHRLGRD